MMANKQKRIITAYESLLSQDKISSIHGLKRQIYLCEIKSDNWLDIFLLKIKNEFNLALRQKLCLVLLNTKFNSKVLISKYSGKPSIFCVPREWLCVLSNFCSVNKSSTLIKFYLFIFLYGIKSILKSTEWIYRVFTYKNDEEIRSKPYSVFHDLLYSNLPIVGNDDSNTIIDWYVKNFKNVKDIPIIAHTLIKDNYRHKELQIVEEFSYIASISFVKKMQLIFYFIYIIFSSMVLFLFGRWEYLFMIGDILKSKFYQNISSDLLAKEYLFSYSNLDYRPLWTYIVADRGADVTFWAYASSLSGVKKKNGEHTFTDYAWEISTWPTILVFTKAFKEFIERIISYESKVLLFNSPIANTDNLLPKFLYERIDDKTVISLFDVSPVSDVNAALLLHDPKYRTVENGKKFIDDICITFESDKYIILFKVKRPLKLNSIFDKTYIEYIESLTKSYKNIFLCHGDISAEKIIKLSNLCISIPFTSTAFIASMLNVESIFYDASGIIQLDDRNLQGVRLISGKDELMEYKNQYSNERS